MSIDQYHCQIEETPAELSPEDIQNMAEYCQARKDEMSLERTTYFLLNASEHVYRFFVVNCKYCKNRFMIVTTYFSRLYPKIYRAVIKFVFRKLNKSDGFTKKV